MKIDISVGGGGAGRAVDPKYFSFRQNHLKNAKLISEKFLHRNCNLHKLLVNLIR